MSRGEGPPRRKVQCWGSLDVGTDGGLRGDVPAVPGEGGHPGRGPTKAPAPVSNVELTYGEGGLVAAAYYGGYATKDEVERRSAELVEAIEASDYAVAGETYSAAYNDPFTPPWRRRNEVLVAVEKRA